MKVKKIMDEILQEYLRASKTFKPMASPHEGYAIIKEELDELWDEVKINSDPLGNMRNEAIQVAAMGMRFVIDCCSKENTSIKNSLSRKLEESIDILNQSPEYIDWEVGQPKAILDGSFTIKELTALIYLMRHEKAEDQS